MDGITINIHGISTMIKESIKELYMDLERDLLFDMPTYHAHRDSLLLSKSGGRLEDDLLDRRVRYSFIFHTSNRCSENTSHLL